MKITMPISVLLALSIVSGFIYVADRHLADHSTKKVTREPTQPEEATISRPEEAQQLMRKRLIEPTQKSSRKISKCVIHGKTVYSDIECENQLTAKPIEIYETSGIGTKTVQVTPTKKIEKQEPEKKVATIGNIQQVDCAETKARIETLDAWARQPLSGHQQDSIREERRRLISLPC